MIALVLAATGRAGAAACLAYVLIVGSLLALALHGDDAFKGEGR